MPIPTRISDISTTAASNSPAGSDTIGTSLDDFLRAIQAVMRGDLAHKGADIASVAGTTDLGAVLGLMHDITGTETITGFGTVSAGIWKILKFEGAATITHNATSLILLGGASRTVAAGDVGVYISEGSGNWRELAFFSAANGPSKVLQAALATTSGTTKDFTIPAWAKKFTMMLNGVSTDGTELLILQLGDSGGVENTGYLGSTVDLDSASGGTGAQWSSGAVLSSSPNVSAVVHGQVTGVLTDASTHTWSISVNCSRSDTVQCQLGAGTKDLDTVLTTLRLTSTNTPDDFDAGSVSVMVE